MYGISYFIIKIGLWYSGHSPGFHVCAFVVPPESSKELPLNLALIFSGYRVTYLHFSVFGNRYPTGYQTKVKNYGSAV
jgi:hypothetical protein